LTLTRNQKVGEKSFIIKSVCIDEDVLVEIEQETAREHSTVSRMIRILLMNRMAARKEQDSSKGRSGCRHKTFLDQPSPSCMIVITGLWSSLI
jgi:hypothetical protein